ncbi:uracil-DNA glycosylase [Phragmitibacter flavus]|uniref:Type-4 uracil-DNA glycosylase n=1 Tax=Phragmitibacter flavus TaxID=2576071 RepID=A0A5R8K8G4_9BACT|nr:uracil-DNA glycosylase [Phragmitibacter flavus]TLD68255.1 uracil-DNA glycosylase [Phragmitibacter flavus]
MGIEVMARGMDAARELLQTYLEQQRARGVTHVKISGEALQGLKGGPKKVVAVAKVAEPAVTLHTAPRAGKVETGAESKRAGLDRLAERAAQEGANGRVHELGTLREVMVFATGSEDAEIMFIGEAPGAEEEKQSEPFVGPAGQLLTKIIQAMGLRRGEVYISNICKYRPKIDDGRMQGSKNRAPTAAEMEACLPFVVEEIAIVQPKIIVALGATAATGLGIEGKVGSLRSSMQEFRGIPVLVTYHPSYLLRREQEDGGGMREKRLVWEDMMKVMEHVGLPISAKQKGYFSKAGK